MIVAGPAVEEVIAPLSRERVVAISAAERIRAGAAQDRIVAAASAERIGSGPAVEGIVPQSRVERVVAVAAAQQHVVGRAERRAVVIADGDLQRRRREQSAAGSAEIDGEELGQFVASVPQDRDARGPRCSAEGDIDRRGGRRVIAPRASPPKADRRCSGWRAAVALLWPAPASRHQLHFSFSADANHLESSGGAHSSAFRD